MFEADEIDDGLALELILVPRASRPSATFIGPGIHATGSARKPVVVFLKRIL
jgi:hypothetical protein